MQPTKKHLREIVKERLELLTHDMYQSLSGKVSGHLDQLLSDLKLSTKDVIGGFAPIKREPLWATQLAEKEYHWAYPRIDQDDMYYLTSSETSLHVEKIFGTEIPVPKNGDKVTPNLLLVPGIGFGINGERLGRGKGCFDRYLENYKGLKIGICFECQILDDIPMGEHDCFMDYVITETRVLSIYKES